MFKSNLGLGLGSAKKSDLNAYLKTLEKKNKEVQRKFSATDVDVDIKEKAEKPEPESGEDSDLLSIQKEFEDEGCLDFNCIQRTWDIKHFDTRADPTNQTWFWYFVPSHSKVLIRKEVKLYTFTNFFAEVGGYLGLLVGESMVSYLLMSINWLEVIKKRIAAKCQNPEERSAVQS